MNTQQLVSNHKEHESKAQELRESVQNLKDKSIIEIYLNPDSTDDLLDLIEESHGKEKIVNILLETSSEDLWLLSGIVSSRFNGENIIYCSQFLEKCDDNTLIQLLENNVITFPTDELERYIIDNDIKSAHLIGILIGGVTRYKIDIQFLRHILLNVDHIFTENTGETQVIIDYLSRVSDFALYCRMLDISGQILQFCYNFGLHKQGSNIFEMLEQSDDDIFNNILLGTKPSIIEQQFVESLESVIFDLKYSPNIRNQRLKLLENCKTITVRDNTCRGFFFNNLQYFSQCKTVELVKCRGVTDDELQYLINCEKVVLKGCRKITEDGIQFLKDNGVEVEVTN